MPAPPFNQDPGLVERVEDLPVEKLVPHLADQRFDVAVLPRAARRDKERRDSEVFQPLPYSFRRKLRPVVRAQVFRPAAPDKQIRQHLDHVFGSQTSPGTCGQALPRVLIHHDQGAHRLSIVRAFEDEIVGPGSDTP